MAGDAEHAVYTGALVFWNAGAGYGFVRPDGGRRADDAWVHGPCLATSARVVGARLRYAVERTERGPRVLWAALIDAGPDARA